MSKRNPVQIADGTADESHVAISHGGMLKNARSAERRRVGPVEPRVDPMSATTVIKREALCYGRHAAPLSAYGPADVHRVQPTERPDVHPTQRADAGDPLAEQVDEAVAVDQTPAAAHRDAARDSGEEANRAVGLWGRLRLLTKTS